MITLNRVMIAGNLTRDPSLRQTPAGTPVGSFGVALNERYTTAQGEAREDVCFVDVEVWGKQAEACGQYLGKGAPVFVEGRLRCNRWEDSGTGESKKRLLIRAERVQFLSQPARAVDTSQKAPPLRRTGTQQTAAAAS
jgi:single-strand DNA-binding protein